MANTSAQWSSRSGNQTVPLSSPLKQAYLAASKIKREAFTTWRRTVTRDIDVKMENARKKGVFAKTAFNYSVILLGSRCLNFYEPDAEKIINELYDSNWTKVQHGVFAVIPKETASEVEHALRKAENHLKVAVELAELFNGNPYIDVLEAVNLESLYPIFTKAP